MERTALKVAASGSVLAADVRKSNPAGGLESGRFSLERSFAENPAGSKYSFRLGRSGNAWLATPEHARQARKLFQVLVACGLTLSAIEMGLAIFPPAPYSIGMGHYQSGLPAPETQAESGYAHPAYAMSLSEFGRPRPLIQSGGWILEREIPGTNARDAMGCYPIFSCRDWSFLGNDLNDLGDELVSLVLVADPFGSYPREILSSTFQDLVVPFKEHFVTDLEYPAKSFVSKHHHYYARKALASVDVEICQDPAQLADEWSELYGHLVTRHQLRGIKVFSHAAFAKQLRVPGMVALRASHKGETVGAHLWYQQGDVAYSHLTAASDAGYKLMSAYALSWSVIEYFTGKVRWIDWGAGAGLKAEGKDGLTRYKKGWANGSRPVYLCGRILNRAKYEEISRARGAVGNHYFPCYREGELG